MKTIVSRRLSPAIGVHGVQRAFHGAGVRSFSPATDSSAPANAVPDFGPSSGASLGAGEPMAAIAPPTYWHVPSSGLQPGVEPDEYLNNDVKSNAVGRWRARNPLERIENVRGTSDKSNAGRILCEAFSTTKTWLIRRHSASRMSNIYRSG